MDFRMENGGDKELHINIKKVNLHDFRYKTEIDPIYRNILGNFNTNIFEADETHTSTFTEAYHNMEPSANDLDIDLPDHPNLSK